MLTISNARCACNNADSDPLSRFGWRMRQARRKERFSSSADSFAKSEVKRRVSDAEPIPSPLKDAPAAGVPPNEHGIIFIFYTAVKHDSLIAFFRHVWVTVTVWPSHSSDVEFPMQSRQSLPPITPPACHLIQ